MVARVEKKNVRSAKKNCFNDINVRHLLDRLEIDRKLHPTHHFKLERLTIFYFKLTIEFDTLKKMGLIR